MKHFQNPIAVLHNWVDCLPPSLKAFYYAVEASVIGGLSIFVGTLVGYMTSHDNLQGYDWGSSLHILKYSVEIGAAKALWDLLKLYNPKGNTP